MDKVISSIVASYGGDYELNFMEGFPGGVNEYAITKFVEESAVKLLAGKMFSLSHILLWGERIFPVPSEVRCFYSCRRGGEGFNSPLHHPKFDLNETAWLQALLSYARFL
jgi:metal-dependent amidase/aminoacylase/carboxypeptidase family protein